MRLSAFSFALIGYGALATLIALLLYRHLQKVSQKALTDIDKISLKLKDQMQTVDDGKKRIFAILQSMIEGVLVVDAQQKIIMANQALVNAFELKREEIEGRYFWEIFRDSEINQMIDRSLAQQVGFNREHEALLTGSTFDIQSSPVFSGGEFLGLVAVFHDVSKLKELERSRSEFVANVSHELKTPLTSIMGFVETLKEGAINDSANRLKFLDIIEEHSKKLSHLIEDLLVLSKIESGKQELKKEAVDLEKMLASTLRMLEKAVQRKKLKVSIEVTPKPFIFLGDAKLLEQALTNLVDNAVKYNEDSGEIRIQARQENGWIKIEIEDTGIGIPEPDLPRIFERFYRVDKSRSRESGGTGLGLSIVKHILEKHAGRIEAESLPQKGSRFTIFLPKNA